MFEDLIINEEHNSCPFCGSDMIIDDTILICENKECEATLDPEESCLHSI